jgi:hypothetical protein
MLANADLKVFSIFVHEQDIFDVPGMVDNAELVWRGAGAEFWFKPPGAYDQQPLIYYTVVVAICMREGIELSSLKRNKQ